MAPLAPPRHAPQASAAAMSAYTRYKAALSQPAVAATNDAEGQPATQEQEAVDHFSPFAVALADGLADRADLSVLVARVGMPTQDKLRAQGGIPARTIRCMFGALDALKVLPDPLPANLDETGTYYEDNWGAMAMALTSAVAALPRLAAAPTAPLDAFTALFADVADGDEDGACAVGPNDQTRVLDAFGMGASPFQEGDTAEHAAARAHKRSAAGPEVDRRMRLRALIHGDPGTPTTLNAVLAIARQASQAAARPPRAATPHSVPRSEASSVASGVDSPAPAAMWDTLRHVLADTVQEGALEQICRALLRSSAKPGLFDAGFPEASYLGTNRDEALQVAAAALKVISLTAPAAIRAMAADSVTTLLESRTQLLPHVIKAAIKALAPSRHATNAKRSKSDSDDSDDDDSSDMSDVESAGAQGKQRGGFSSEQLANIVELTAFKALQRTMDHPAEDSQHPDGTIISGFTKSKRRAKVMKIFLDTAPEDRRYGGQSMLHVFISPLSKGPKKKRTPARTAICTLFKRIRALLGAFTRVVILDHHADKYDDDDTVDAVWCLLRTLPTLDMVDLLPMFARRAEDRVTAIQAMTMRVYDGALRRMLNCLASVHSGLITEGAIDHFMEAAEEYKGDHAGPFHAQFVKPVLTDILRRYRDKAIETGGAQQRHTDEMAGEAEDSTMRATMAFNKNEPVSVPEYFRKGFAQEQYFQPIAFQWYRTWKSWTRVQTADKPPPTQLKAKAKKKPKKSGKLSAAARLRGTQEAAQLEAKNQAALAATAPPAPGEAGNQLDLTGTATKAKPKKPNAVNLWLTAFKAANVKPFQLKNAWITWFTATKLAAGTAVAPADIPCPYLILQSYDTCPDTEPCQESFRHDLGSDGLTLDQEAAFLTAFIQQNGGAPMDFLHRCKPALLPRLKKAGVVHDGYTAARVHDRRSSQTEGRPKRRRRGEAPTAPAPAAPLMQIGAATPTTAAAAATAAAAMSP